MTIKKIKSSDILGDNYYIYNLTSSNYTPNLNGSITITCTVKNIYGDAIANKSIQLYQNDTAVGSATTTNNNGVATWTITCSTAGIQKFSVKDTVIEIFVDTTSKTGHNHTTLDITNFPEIPTKTSDLTNDSGYLTSHQDISGKANVSDLGDVAFSNDYTDLDNIPSTFSPSTHTHDDRYYTETEIDTALNGKQATLVSGTNIKTINNQSLLGTGDITVGDDVGSFTDLQALIDNASSGDIIILDKDYQCNSETYLTINKSLTIHGNGHIIDGNSMSPILILNGSNIMVTINETTFINGKAYSTAAGGAISGLSLSDNSILSLNHCIFIKNQSITTIGGALAINKNAVINHCIFIENTCKRYGGAIYCNDNTSIIKNCIFKDNIAQSNGNDIYCTRNDLIIYNCDTSSANLYHTTNKPYLSDHQDITGKANTTDLGETAFSNDYNDLDNLPTIPAAYTHPSTHPSSMITDSNTHNNIGNTANTLENIITNIDTKLGSLANVDLIEVTSSLGTASANTMNKLYLVAETTGATNDNYEIFVTVRTGTSGNYSYSWEKVDTARIDLSDYLTTANAQQTYVAKESGKGLFSGSYNDLTNKPNIPTDVSDLTDNNDTPFTPKSHTHIISDVANLQTILNGKINISDLGNLAYEDDVDLTTHDVSELTDTQNTAFTPTSHTHGNLQNNGQVGTSNNASKNVVTDSNGYITTEAKPTIDTTITSSSSNAVTSSAIYSELQSKQPNLFELSTEMDIYSNYIFYDDSLVFFSTNNRIYHDYVDTNELHFLDSNDNDVSFDDIILEGDSRLTNARTPTSHTHGNINNDGTITTVKTIDSNTENIGADYFIIRENSGNATKSANILDVFNKIIEDLIDEGDS